MKLFQSALPRPAFKPRVIKFTKHAASKPGAKHYHKVLGFTNVGKLPITNHERVVVLRARRQGISVQDYCRKYGAVLPVR
jgi:predicted GNAT superfamily acetyltransferase